MAPQSDRHPGAPSKLVEGAGYAAALLRSRVPYRPRTAIIRIHGDHAVEAVTIARVDRQGRPMVGTERELAVDLVGLGWGFTPSLELVLAAGADTRLDVDGSLVAGWTTGSAARYRASTWPARRPVSEVPVWRCGRERSRR